MCGACHNEFDPGVPWAADARRQRSSAAAESGPMAKSNTVQIKLISSAETGYFYVTKKNTRAQTGKLAMKKYDPVVRKHVEFREAKIK
jgi:large subunit ribosomal protein L33